MYLKKSAGTIAILFLLVSPFFVAAAVNPSERGFINQDERGYVNQPASFKLQNPLNFETICGLIQGLLKVFITIGIPIAVLFLVYSGFLFVWARGSVDGLKKAKRNFFYTLLGIALFLGAWFLGQVIASTINALSPGTVGQTSCK
ncbi:hypothetical protein A2852_01260 [Candidatus Adlerbacteria bacterium RIFCSPHIGHO2_01_FULL_54_23]|uniref:Uncharacterized protein n=3 Tax=Candidatus Adleribacteriota TaxID=1752736 RepID=A0A1F4Y0B6_9BACT|nr:MAG: hypothetical protein UY83_C0006G0079 [Candidatus Adlerbacteria bacterium GW2011_GWA1_54_10]KKW37741.1 MAG: hypothetical protein UY86_C0004G0070 [Candidatus Adlerbacteria bacterium GW2011_GWB1_54_7]OGC79281.1 MAG: hypothetical protein A2852_01260 [Candidatus Adlerbacteria bacterium RIFCSPHIGHO2_01_FULL_54_23]OGC87298.1 MAG: hypothetical protein A3B33_00810 [Candidatus Adlerbacteria bacterium RIFCSPLOWO2_01_FULL_54_16]